MWEIKYGSFGDKTYRFGPDMVGLNANGLNIFSLNKTYALKSWFIFFQCQNVKTQFTG